jgi:gluconate kinase, FGGY family (EC 2.7.1.12)
MNVSIGLDIGTTQTKAVAFTDEAQEAASAYFRYPFDPRNTRDGRTRSGIDLSRCLHRYKRSN